MRRKGKHKKEKHPRSRGAGRRKSTINSCKQAKKKGRQGKLSGNKRRRQGANKHPLSASIDALIPRYAAQMGAQTIQALSSVRSLSPLPPLPAPASTSRQWQFGRPPSHRFAHALAKSSVSQKICLFLQSAGAFAASLSSSPRLQQPQRLGSCMDLVELHGRWWGCQRQFKDSRYAGNATRHGKLCFQEACDADLAKHFLGPLISPDRS